ncbi:hypothetical protein [Tumebacillus flagellatus]|uniref:Uncharacterized protein n=1 Tax=Tumebacillus flagellatus TaxID=1157490 RepID=A0A074LNK3_9BACL|nr:hypothetical protein [Tumebacillus flagellatus]KEO82075.1 hypothetical protein EL26_17350 [Tumebacillus flagellatus]
MSQHDQNETERQEQTQQTEQTEQADSCCSDSTCKTTDCCGHSLEIEHLEDGYRITVRGDREKVQQHRRVMESYVNFLKEQKKSRWWLPLPLRWILKWFHLCK